MFNLKYWYDSDVLISKVDGYVAVPSRIADDDDVKSVTNVIPLLLADKFHPVIFFPAPNLAFNATLKIRTRSGHFT